MGALYKEADGKGMLLDDCVEYSFLFGPNRNRPHVEPWVGIFHFPSCIDSPVKEDLLQHSAEAVLRNPTFHASRKYLQSGIAMTQELASWLTEWLQVPFSVVKHPTDTNVPQWSLESFLASPPLLLQLGFDLRNTRAIYHIVPVPGWRYARIKFRHPEQIYRDKHLQQVMGGECNSTVEEWDRLSNGEYDKVLSSCVAISEAFAIGGTNVVVECIARGTPLLTNQVAGATEYLGTDYPLYLENFSELSPSTLLQAHQYLLSIQGSWLDCGTFAKKVREIVDQ